MNTGNSYNEGFNDNASGAVDGAEPTPEQSAVEETPVEAETEGVESNGAPERDAGEPGDITEDMPEDIPEDMDQARALLASLREELADAKDSALRAVAEAQNARRRAEQDVEKARKFALERFVGELLAVVDNLERAAEAAGAAKQAGDEAVQSLAEGVELTRKSLLDVLGRFNVEVIDPAGAPFDHDRHQAMATVPNPDAEPNTVLEVMQKGYTLSGRLVRPAMVVVSKAPDQAPDQAPE